MNYALNKKIIIHVDMDAFFAAVEMRDNPALRGKPLIIGALPEERGVVSTCSYEARKYGVRSAMSIKEAYRRCPNGIYMHPNGEKYHAASQIVHRIWDEYTDQVEYVSLDEGYLDVTGSVALLGTPEKMAREIKQKVLERVGITCSVGIGYSMMSAKLASEEKKPDGLFEIRSPAALRELITDRDVRTIPGIGAKTAEALKKLGILTVADLYKNRAAVLSVFGKNGRQIMELADGIDNRVVTPYEEPKSIGKEHTFQKDISDFDYLQDALLQIARDLSFAIHRKGIYAGTVTLKITYADMKQITRSKSGEITNRAAEIYNTAKKLLSGIQKRPVRLVGISLSSLTTENLRQISFENQAADEKAERIDKAAFELQMKYGKNAIRTAKEFVKGNCPT